MKNLTVRNVPPGLGEALEREKRRRGTSLNQTVLDLLSQGLGADGPGPRRNGLKALAGTWSAEEFEGFERAVAVTEQVDEELWQ
ncbi:MAG: antitoxin [Proteobacteria bacterium]|nr:antitoxin [Pseudomonadota bacterium]